MNIQGSHWLAALVTILGLGWHAVSAEAVSPESAQKRVRPGQELKVEGVIVERAGSRFVLRDRRDGEITVLLTEDTEIEERKKNPFRDAKLYDRSDLIRGLLVQVEGYGDGWGRLVAEEIKFRQDDFKVARALDLRLDPVERRLADTEADHRQLSGQVEELDQMSRRLRQESQDLRRTAEEALQQSGEARQRADSARQVGDSALGGLADTNRRIAAVDDFQVVEEVSVFFPFASAKLSEEAKDRLDQLVARIQSEKGFVIEVRGFASPDGNAHFNRRLSEERAESVRRYLVEHHQVPLRRVLPAHGFGESNPVADNSTGEGRRQNRRAQVRVLASEGLAQAAEAASPAHLAGKGPQ